MAGGVRRLRRAAAGSSASGGRARSVAISSASARANRAGSAGRRSGGVEVVDDLVEEVLASSTKVTSRSTSPAMPRPERTCRQKPCVVSIVAASKSAMALASRSRRRSHLVAGPVGQELHDSSSLVAAVDAGESVDRPVDGADEALADPLAQLARGHAGEGDDEQPVERQYALGDVAGREGGDGEGLARCRRSPRAASRRSGGGRRRRRAAGPALRSVRRHRSTTCSWASSPSQSRRA